MILDGKTVVVSGVGPGLGREIAAAAAREGANVAIGARTRANLEKAAAEIDPSGAKVAWEVTDITDREQCARLAATAIDRFGTIDALGELRRSTLCSAGSRKPIGTAGGRPSRSTSSAPCR